jgi:hypothetical protein
MRITAIVSALVVASGSAFAANVIVDGHGTGYTPSKNKAGKLYFAPVVDPGALPDNYDLRDLGLVTPVKDQGQCGSCWAFGSTSAFEGSLLLSKTGTFDLSEQQVVSCDTAYSGCNGGDYAYDFMVEKGQALEQDFPYRASDVRCKSGLTPAAHAASWAYIGTSSRGPNVDELRQAIYDHGVVGISVAADNWSGYHGGVFTKCGMTGVDHLVSAVGWHKQPDGTFTFLVKNSWGTSWGDKGYIEMALGCDNLGSDAAFVVAKSARCQPPHGRLPASVYTAFAQPTTIGVHAESGVRYEWLDASGAVVGDASLLEVAPRATGTYKLKSANDCGTAESLVKVVVEGAP